jgi:FlaG/FlaF family flagellin (archaellin)
MRANRHNSADSEVIAELLLISISVLLAAIIGATVFGLAGNMQKTQIVGVVATRGSDGFISVTYHGGEEAQSLRSLQITVNGSDYGFRNLSLDGGTRALNVGNSTQMRGPLPRQDHVVVAGTFADGRQQVVLDTFV